MDLVPFLSVTPGMNGPLIHRTETHGLTSAPAPLAALAFRRWLGGEAAINAYCHDLAMKGGKRLAQLLGTKVMDETGELTLSMVRQDRRNLSTSLTHLPQTNVLLPLPVETPGDKVIYTPETIAKIYVLFRDKFFTDFNTYPGHYFHAGGWWARISIQVWNEVSDHALENLSY